MLTTFFFRSMKNLVSGSNAMRLSESTGLDLDSTHSIFLGKNREPL